jgi:hypothetical protein
LLHSYPLSFFCSSTVEPAICLDEKIPDGIPLIHLLYAALYVVMRQLPEHFIAWGMIL